MICKICGKTIYINFGNESSVFCAKCYLKQFSNKPDYKKNLKLFKTLLYTTVFILYWISIYFFHDQLISHNFNHIPLSLLILIVFTYIIYEYFSKREIRLIRFTINLLVIAILGIYLYRYYSIIGILNIIAILLILSDSLYNLYKYLSKKIMTSNKKHSIWSAFYYFPRVLPTHI